MLITSKIGSLLFVACIVMQLASTLAAQNIQHDYCILGAGPGGLQVGHLMLKRGWDYITFERNARPGSFFETYPVHRQLISLNKRYTGRNSKEFNLRHDWNSLLDSVRLFIFSLSLKFFLEAELRERRKDQRNPQPKEIIGLLYLTHCIASNSI